MDLGTKLRARLPGWLTRLSRNGASPGHEAKSILGSESGVRWVGNPDTRQIIYLEGGGSNPDAESLTRSIALATSTYCYVASEYRWRTVSEPPLAVYRDTEDGPELIENHPLDILLKEPSPDFDMGELLGITEAYLLTTGAALWLKMSDELGFAGVLPYSGDQFTTEADGGRIYGKFHVDTGKGRKTYGPDEVVFFRETNPNSWRTWLSKLDVALAQLDLGHQVNRTVRQFMRNAMFPGGVISPHQEWNPDDDEFAQYTNRIKAWHSGPANAGQPLVLLGGTQFSSTTLRLKDLLPDELLDRIEANVASVYGIPPVVLGFLVGLKNSPWSQMSEARRMTYEDTIEPRWRFFEKAMTRQTLTPAERVADFRVMFDTTEIRALQADDASRADTATKLRDEWTRDERRIYTGQEPIGGELGEEIGTSGGGSGFGDLGGDGDLETEEMAGSGPPARKISVDPKNLAWLLFDANTKAAESTWEREVASELDKQRKAVVELAGKYLQEAKADGNPVDANSASLFIKNVEDYLGGEALPEFVTASFPLIYSTGSAGVKNAARQIGVSFSILQEGLDGYASREAAFLADVMTETTAKDIAKAVQASLDAGETVNALTKRLEELPAFDRARARLTARTETTRAWNGAQREQLTKYQEESGRQVEKSWLSSRDGDVRPTHELQDNGVWYPIDAVFEEVQSKQPNEPNCRCTMIYRIAPASA